MGVGVNCLIVGSGGQCNSQFNFRRPQKKLVIIVMDSTQAFYLEFDSSRIKQSGRLRSRLARADYFKKSVLPSTILVFNGRYDPNQEVCDRVTVRT